MVNGDGKEIEISYEQKKVFPNTFGFSVLRMLGLVRTSEFKCDIAD